MDILDLSIGEKKSRRKAQIPQRRPMAVPNGSYALPIMKSEQQRIEMLVNCQGMGAIQTRVLQKPPFDEHDSSGELEAQLTRSPCLSERSNDNDDSRNPSPDMLLVPHKNAFSANLRMLTAVADPAPSYNYNSSPIVSNAGSPSPALQNKRCSSVRSSSSELCDSRPPFVELSDRTGPSSELKDVVRGAGPPYKMAKYGDDIRPADTPGIPERTKKQNRWAFNVWREWAKKRNITNGAIADNQDSVPLDVGKASEVELDHWLSKFVQEVRRKDGNPYPPHTLMQIVMGIQRYLRQQAGRPSICILDRSNPIYSGFRSVLDERIKQLTNDGVVTTGKTGRRSSLPSGSHGLASGPYGQYPDESSLWEAGVIGYDTALRLLNAVFYHNTVTFGIRTIDDHWNLKMCHFNVSKQPPFFVEFAPSLDPVYVNRGLNKNRKIFEEIGNPRCVVKLFRRYVAHVPPNGAFYRHPQEPTLVDRSIRFSDQWIGKNRLRAMIKHIFDNTRLDGGQKTPQRQVEWPTLALNAPSSNNSVHIENRLVSPYAATEIIYDRLAQAVLHLSSRNKSSALHDNTSAANYDSPQNGDRSPSRSAVDSEKSEPASNVNPDPCPETDGRSFDSETRRRTRSESGSSSDSGGDKCSDETSLEITVPGLLKTVIINRGSKRTVVNLD